MKLFFPVLGIGPDAHTKAVQDSKERQLQATKEDPTSQWIKKITDTNSDKVIVAAMWHIFRTNPYEGASNEPLSADWWPKDSGGKKLTELLLREFTGRMLRRTRRAYMRMSNLSLHDRCFTHPDHRKRGAGSLLVRWGVEKADELGLDSFVEATNSCTSLYERHGFVASDSFNIKTERDDASEDWMKLVKELSIEYTFLWKLKYGKWVDGETTFPWREGEYLAQLCSGDEIKRLHNTISKINFPLVAEMSNSSLRSFEYLEKLPGTVFKRLYQQPSTALAIFRRMLPHLAKCFVTAMLYISSPLPVSDLESWVRTDSKRERDSAISLLERLNILTTAATVPGQPRAYSLTEPFATSLRQALTGGGNHKSFGVPCDTPKQDRVSIIQLDSFARRQWEAVLGYMVGSTGINVADEGVVLSEGVKTLLTAGELVKRRGTKTEITQTGFAFILQEVNAQIWTVLIYYLDNAKELRMDDVDILSFLFTLSSLTLGQAYSKANLTLTQHQMLEDLGDFGVVYHRGRDSPYFYPTRLATTLTSETNALSSSFAPNPLSTTTDSPDKGYVVIETNYRLYAYTSSPLQIAILQLFCRLNTRYPNMVSGKISRESIRRAVAMGITSDQIISYMQNHAHPQMSVKFGNGNPVLPPTVVDQIRLWQIEGERMKATPGFLFKEFANRQDYENIAAYASELGVLVWRNDARAMFFVTRYDQVAAYLKSRGKKGQGT
ncbi:RNA polymerase II transcription factor B 52 kDa subunit [Agyrium rufum]|nr:RNA polymerase II transcription factor B 52 kDa subunit [Agyrium rufum]